ncbi:CsgBAC operon transcriptional regulatory protein [Providencia rustigianii]|uniref:CsgBAC operon transcriptional regulatory protein n=1 Tax=Providencia rustigianii TaxID=158850 RepID=A0A379G0C8_9GAMM|nr:LuxR family transcriptional regulator [Providencia rustigianii]SUC34450.1 CsgBAC operon transcriptional regulatory protein [Providencia rustigianii]
MEQPLFSYHQQALIDCCLNTIAHIIPISAAVYYLVNDYWQPENHVLYGISPHMHHEYLTHFSHHDPLHPDHFRGEDLQLVKMAPEMRQQNKTFFHDFMQPNQLADMAEIFIRRKNKIIAGISVLRDKPFTPQEVVRLNAILPIAELMTFDVLPDSLVSYTPKEQEIIHLVREGASNKRIALLLGISLSTVKTHLRNIFTKANVSNRTELVSSGFIIRQDKIL